MPLLDQGLSYYQNLIFSYWNQPGTKRLATLFAIFISLIIAYRRIQTARTHEQNLNRRNNLNGNSNNNIRNNNNPLNPTTTAASVNATSLLNRAVNAASNSIPAVLTPAKRYLQTNKVKPIVVIGTNDIIFSTSDNSFDGNQLPFLVSLATHTNLFLLTVINEEINRNKGKLSEEYVTQVFTSAGLFDCGLKPHRLLYCSSIKGKQSVYRHLEPQLCIDSNEEILQSLKPFIPDCVLIRKTTSIPPSTQLMSHSQPIASAPIIPLPSMEFYFMGATNINTTNQTATNNSSATKSTSPSNSNTSNINSVNTPGLSLVKSHPAAVSH